MASLFRTIRGNEYSNPKTVLGFYAGVLVIIEIGVIAALGFLVSQNDLHHLIPWLLAFGGALFVVVIAIVVAINVIDPTKLQLAPMTGREFTDHQRVTRGDSIGGEYVEAPSAEVEDGQIRVLPPAADREEQDDA